MGPSGSGKTTLLDVLAGRKTVGTATGTLLFGSTAPSKAFLRRFTGYVEQFDTLLGILTVEEMVRPPRLRSGAGTHPVGRSSCTLRR